MDSPIELLSQDTDDEDTEAPVNVASTRRTTRRIRIIINGQTRVLRWYSGTSTSELLQNVRDLAHLNSTTVFRLRDTRTQQFVELTPCLASGTTLELIEDLQAAASVMTVRSNLSPLLPHSWSNVRTDEDPPAAVELNAHSHAEVWSSVTASFACVGEVQKIVRCESSDLWSTFVLEKKKLVKQFRARAAREQVSDGWRCSPGCWASGSVESNVVSGAAEERILFHTANASVDAIFQEGFDLRLASAGNFGRGIYFSDDPKKCDQYWKGRHSGAPEDGTRVMFVAQVLLGESKVYRKGKKDPLLVREPERNATMYRNTHQHSTDRYDSVQGYIYTADEFIIYQNGRAYPMYAVSYKPHTVSSTVARAPFALTAVSVKFVNSGCHTKSLYWIPALSSQHAGQETKIKPGEDVCIRTFDTHKWEVRSTGRTVLRVIVIDAALGASQTIDIENGVITSSRSSGISQRLRQSSRAQEQREQAEMDRVLHQSAMKYLMEQTGEVLEARAARLLRMHNGDASRAIAVWRKEKGLLPAASVGAAVSSTATFTMVQVQQLPQTGVAQRDIRSFFMFAVVPAPTITQVNIEGTEAFVEFSTAAEARQALEKSGDMLYCGGNMHAVQVRATTRQFPKDPLSALVTPSAASPTTVNGGSLFGAGATGVNPVSQSELGKVPLSGSDMGMLPEWTGVNNEPSAHAPIAAVLDLTRDENDVNGQKDDTGTVDQVRFGEKRSTVPHTATEDTSSTHGRINLDGTLMEERPSKRRQVEELD